MEFDKNYFEAEVREGFYVTSDIKHAWAAQLEVLSDVDKACRENGIQYFAEWGTLLGAIRHHGFIPWEDDMDIKDGTIYGYPTTGGRFGTEPSPDPYGIHEYKGIDYHTKK